MPRELSDIRKDIDALDQQIVASLFDEGINEENPESADITKDEIAQICTLQLHFSAKTWALLNQRMALSREVWENKKATKLDVVVDKERYEVVIARAQSHAPEYAREEVRKLYNLIHDISVRIQQEIIGTP